MEGEALASNAEDEKVTRRCLHSVRVVSSDFDSLAGARRADGRGGTAPPGRPRADDDGEVRLVFVLRLGGDHGRPAVSSITPAPTHTRPYSR